MKLLRRLLCNHPYFCGLIKPNGAQRIVCIRCGKEY